MECVKLKEQATSFFLFPFSRKIKSMRSLLLGFFLLAGIEAISQDTTTMEVPKQPETDYIWIFSSPRLINANTVELQPKGILEFKVTHNFGDVGGDDGGVKNFFGLDNATDVRIGFQYGLSKRINLIAARAKGAGPVQQLYELGIKYRILQQANDSKHPLSLTVFANTVVSSMKANAVANQENSFDDLGDRLSETVVYILSQISFVWIHRRGLHLLLQIHFSLASYSCHANCTIRSCRWEILPRNKNTGQAFCLCSQPAKFFFHFDLYL